jgi:hypothetical protein
MYGALVSATGGCGSNGRHGRTIYRQIVGEICPKSGADLPDMGIAGRVCGARRRAVKLDIEVSTCRGIPVDAISPTISSFTPRISSISVAAN